jgi:hypothetical protein
MMPRITADDLVSQLISAGAVTTDDYIEPETSFDVNELEYTPRIDYYSVAWCDFYDYYHKKGSWYTVCYQDGELFSDIRLAGARRKVESHILDHDRKRFIPHYRVPKDCPY